MVWAIVHLPRWPIMAFAAELSSSTYYPQLAAQDWNWKHVQSYPWILQCVTKTFLTDQHYQNSSI